MKLFIFVFLVYTANILNILAEDLYPVVEDDKLGYINAKGEIVIKPSFKYDFEYITSQSGNKEIDLPVVNERAYYHCGRAIVSNARYVLRLFRVGYDYYLINCKADTIKKLKAEQIGEFRDGLAPYKDLTTQYRYVIDKTFRFIDTNGFLNNTNSFQYLSPLHEGLAIAQDSTNMFGFVDKKMDMKIDFRFADAGYFSEGLAPVKTEDKYGYINAKGELVIDTLFEYANPFSEGLALVYLDGRYFFIDKKGRKAYDRGFKYAEGFSSGYALIVEGTRKKFIDHNGNEVRLPGHSDLSSFRHGMARIRINRRFGFLDSNLKLIVMPDYDYAMNYHGEMAVVVKGTKAVYIDKTGKVVHPYFWEDERFFLRQWFNF